MANQVATRLRILLLSSCGGIGPGVRLPSVAMRGLVWMAFCLSWMTFGWSPVQSEEPSTNASQKQAGNAQAGAPRFERDILPLLRQRCEHCHGPEERESNLDVQSIGALLRGGSSGPVIVPGEPEQSILMDVLSHGDMPPAGDERVSAEELAVIRRWIADGVEAREAARRAEPSGLEASSVESAKDHASTAAPSTHGAFSRLRRPAIPSVDAGRASSEIDSFLWAKLQSAGLGFSPPATPARLLRRVSLDLTGLPPSPETLAAFERDSSPRAYEQLVDRLLASPEFGVRWGRHWLDWVGYTDTISFDSDMGPPEGFYDYKWRYRDYIVRSFNEDRPYDQMIRQQLAGDEMVSWRGAKRYTPEILDALTATGFLRCSEDLTGEDRRPFTVWSVLHDTMSQIGTSLLGVSLTCARCHSHKFEPVSQQDYYQMMALFTPAFNPDDWKTPRERAVADIPLEEQSERDCWNLVLDKQVEALDAAIARVNQPYERTVQVGRLQALGRDAEGKEILPWVLAALDTPAPQRDSGQRQILIKHEQELKVPLAEVEPRWSDADAAAIRELRSKIAVAKSQRREYGWLHAVYDVGPPPATRLLQAGSHEAPRREVPAGFLRVLSPPTGVRASEYSPDEEGGLAESLQDGSPRGSGRRLRLAHWMTDPQSPAGGLVARVMVNRIWEHLLGQAIVHPSDNLGMSGTAPTHPELLEWMASEFVADGWSIKRMIRRIVMTDAYRQSSSAVGDGLPVAARGWEVDPDNQLLWRARLRRIEAEPLRDSLLWLAGQLVLDQGGPPVSLQYSIDGYVDVDDQRVARPADSYRRSIYLLQRRIAIPTFLLTFDKPAVTGCVTYRDDGAVPLQSLTMLNDRLILQQSRKLAKRVMAAAPDAASRQIDLAYRLAYGRGPTDDERTWCLDSLARQRELHRAAAAIPPQDANAQTRDAEADEAEWRCAALAGVCQALLGASEFLYLE